MTKVDRRILKTQEALKTAVIKLMAEKNFDDITIQDLSDQANVSRGTIYLHYMDKYDLLDKLIENHINELQERCEAAADLDFVTGSLIWTEYFESNYDFFSMMLASKGAPFFRNRFLEFLIEEFKDEVDNTKGKNEGLNKDLVVRFVASSYVGVVEWWFTNKRPVTHQVLAEQLGALLDRICE
ncbi:MULTISPECIES: TetR/AcrR family transcriptional regulator [Paenibacillus]|uniref:TetR/AcrR family transcriptional regulator n=1 Tax=Paenibacillus TaxID=44249 RepID=UPI00096BFA54|nr:TetR/AcrR family transcriptional regulator [Paenibacillus odorifer]MEC0134147.1 TetR/AcrR family transcriptional regulator [Paenibacillus odorifer]MEC0222567.1 TetR/AcrR family transcriptional regulator [Paenibacillus odorifer]OMC94017.1 TetR family transcriptional regulator [Paenibacillus odorifer]OMD03644.1 TetR family transcriptional regulator [Paenibacillus odorifer]OMD15106.1 TetR family transcriptional regulator [Paenibacillus odorifer]